MKTHWICYEDSTVHITHERARNGTQHTDTLYIAKAATTILLHYSSQAVSASTI